MKPRSRLPRLPVLVAALAASAALLAGCGPSDSEPTATKAAAPLSDAPVMAAVAAGKANAAWRVPIQGMSCDGCAGGIQSELLRTPGVAAAAVGFAEGLAVVAVDTNKLSFEALAKVVADAGYKASPPQP
jgi:Cu+-exporting ATPase